MTISLPVTSNPIGCRPASLIGASSPPPVTGLSLRRHAQRRRSWTGATQPAALFGLGALSVAGDTAAAQAQATRTAPLGGAVTDVAGVQGRALHRHAPPDRLHGPDHRGGGERRRRRRARRSAGHAGDRPPQPTNLVDRVPLHHDWRAAAPSARGRNRRGAFLEEKGIGFLAGPAPRAHRAGCHPLRSRHGRPSHPPDAEAGYKACAAARDEPKRPRRARSGPGGGERSARPIASPAP